MDFEKNDIMINSHRRSNKDGIKEENKKSNKSLQEGESNKVLGEFSELVRIAKIYFDIYNNILKNEEFTLILTDKNGYILYASGNDKTIEKYKNINISPEIYIDEKDIGTNVIKTVLREDRPIQVIADEHYINILKTLTYSAAPIHEKNGEVVGTLTLISAFKNRNPHLLDLVLFGTKAIENDLGKIYEKNSLIATYNCTENAIDNKEDSKEKNKEIPYKTFDDIIGKSYAISNVIENCKVISNSPSTILLQGESGTGKEILAEAIHSYSSRRNNNFVKVDCGLIDKEFIEVELFGCSEKTIKSAKGEAKKGKFEIANGGTLFLDKIEEMPIEIQNHLLRALQQRKITRIGDTKEIPVDVRIIVSTNKDLKDEIKKGTFKEELFYILSVLAINIPPLRERKGDVDILIKHLMRIISQKLNKAQPKLNKELYNKLINYSWPGNVRELKNCIENIVNQGGNLSYELNNMNNKDNKELNKGIKEIDNGIYIELGKNFNIKDIEKILIKKAVEHNCCNMSKTARSLGISRNTLYYKVNKYKIF